MITLPSYHFGRCFLLACITGCLASLNQPAHHCFTASPLWKRGPFSPMLFSMGLCWPLPSSAAIDFVSCFWEQNSYFLCLQLICMHTHCVVRSGWKHLMIFANSSSVRVFFITYGSPSLWCWSPDAKTRPRFVKTSHGSGLFLGVDSLGAIVSTIPDSLVQTASHYDLLSLICKLATYFKFWGPCQPWPCHHNCQSHQLKNNLTIVQWCSCCNTDQTSWRCNLSCAPQTHMYVWHS